MDTTEIIGSIHGSPGDALKLLEESVHLKSVVLRDVDVTAVASRALCRMLDEAVVAASKLSYTAGQRPSVVVYDNDDGGIKAYFDVVEVYDDELVVKVATNMVTDAIYAYEPARDEAIRQIIEVAEIYGYVKVRIPMTDALRTLCKAAAWHYSVTVLLNDIPGKLV
ncbi:MAG: hypothetical protein MJZ17_05405 [Bacteroidales bacterium]|nr:hypothetical protein [Bacteroidales bacterium]